MTVCRPRITICIPHWQAKVFMTLCLRSIRKHSSNYDLEVIVVDNGSRDESLEYLRSLSWIRLIERPDETHTNWPTNVFTAWDRGIRAAEGELFVTMHSDVFVKRDGWLDPFIREMAKGPKVAATGSWKLELENPIYAWQKRFLGYSLGSVKTLLGIGRPAQWRQNYPRDYCAMYRRQVLVDHNMAFLAHGGGMGGGNAIARQIWNAGYSTSLFSVREMAGCVYHVAHGTAAVAPEKRLRHARKQKQTERKVAQVLQSDWVRSLQRDHSLDRTARAA